MSQQEIRLANLYTQQADICRQQSDIEGAVGHYTKAIDIYKKMAEEEPAVFALVADTIEAVGATYKAAGMLDKAMETLKEAAMVREWLVTRRAESDAG